MPDVDSDKFIKYQVDNTKPVHQQADVFTAFTMMIETTRNRDLSDREASMLKIALNRNMVYPVELYEAFWKAYQDQYTPAAGIEWRHLWKHIELQRKGRELRLYSYREMCTVIGKEGITTDHFKRDDELARKLQQKYPDKDITDLQVWKRL